MCRTAFFINWQRWGGQVNLLIILRGLSIKEFENLRSNHFYKYLNQFWLEYYASRNHSVIESVSSMCCHLNSLHPDTITYMFIKYAFSMLSTLF
jgi:hypothetical protein